VVDGILGAQQQQQQGDQSLRLRLAGLQQRAPRSPEDTRAYVRPGVPLRAVLAEDAQPAHLQLAKRLLSWSLDEFRVRPQRQQRLQLSTGAGGMRMSQPRAAVLREIGSGRLQQAKIGRLQGTGAQSAWAVRGRSHSGNGARWGAPCTVRSHSASACSWLRCSCQSPASP
jgi:hypothetical protein